MKRHESLAPLSREHHTVLILAQLLKKNAPAYKDLPQDTTGKIEYALKIFNELIQEHFIKEEAMLETIKSGHSQIELLKKEIVTEHRDIAAAFEKLKNTDSPEAGMHALAILLDLHIRKEERVLFPLMQQVCSEKELEHIGLLLH